MTPAKKAPSVRPAKSGPVTLVPGYKDQLPTDAALWDHLRACVERLRVDFGYTYIATPLVEEARLYAPTKAGALVPEEELVLLPHSDGPQLVLRPENTLGLARAYREHAYANLPQPIRLFYQGPQFRNLASYGSGTYRQFTQFGFEVFNDPQSVVDAQLIAAFYFLQHEMGLTVQLHLNSMGHPECRQQYEKVLLEYLRPHRAQLCEACKERLTAKHPLHVLTCDQSACQEVLVQAPQIIDHLCDADREHFVHVLEHLDEVDVSYELDPHLFRSPVTHNRTVVQFVAPLPNGTSMRIAAGGRHDQLLTVVGGETASAFGLAGSYERVYVALREQGVTPPPAPAPDVFLAQLGDAARRKSLQLLVALRTDGIRVAENLSRDGIKGQLEYATSIRAKFALIIGQKEIVDGTILLRDMENGIQEVVDFPKAIPELKKRLTKAAIAQLSASIPDTATRPQPTASHETVPHA